MSKKNKQKNKQSALVLKPYITGGDSIWPRKSQRQAPNKPRFSQKQRPIYSAK